MTPGKICELSRDGRVTEIIDSRFGDDDDVHGLLEESIVGSEYFTQPSLDTIAFDSVSNLSGSRDSNTRSWSDSVLDVEDKSLAPDTVSTRLNPEELTPFSDPGCWWKVK